jgi:hypothetical protein
MSKTMRETVIAVSLLFVAAFLIFRYCTLTEEVPLVLSKAILDGRVLYKGKPVPHALVIVQGADSVATGVADDHGRYNVLYAPVGDVRFGVNTVAGRGMMTGAMMAGKISKTGDRPMFIDVPSKYFDPVSSGLIGRVDKKVGQNTFDIKID